nr:uncharacterized protein LOC107374218 isoform X2 [Nothobranchius furzeri]
MGKGIGKKIEELGKRKTTQDVRLWKQSVVNHLYWSASSSSSGQEAVAKWTSVANHVQNVHSHDNALFPSCLHAPLDGEQARQWLKPRLEGEPVDGYLFDLKSQWNQFSLSQDAWPLQSLRLKPNLELCSERHMGSQRNNTLRSQVKRQLERLNRNKAAGPDGVSPRVLKACAEQLCGILQHLFNLSRAQEKVPVLWKTSCLVPVPKKTRQSVNNDYRPVALTSHIMKVLERILLVHLNKQTRTYQCSLLIAMELELKMPSSSCFNCHGLHLRLPSCVSLCSPSLSRLCFCMS